MTPTRPSPGAPADPAPRARSWRDPRWHAVFLVQGLLFSACSPAPAPEEKNHLPPQPAWFEEKAVPSGLDFTHQSGHQDRFLFPEIMCGGVGLLDYDQDGFLDVYCVQAGSIVSPPHDRPGNRLYRNRGNGTFEDVTQTAGVNDRGYGMGCISGDVDQDGDVDLYVTNLGPNVLYRNNGDGTFTDVTRHARVGNSGWGASASFLDYDRDGDLDLYVANYIHWSLEGEIPCYSRGGKPDYCSPVSYRAPAKDVLYQNLGDGTFTDVSESAGIASAFGNGLGVVCADFNGDGWTDIYVANDATPNQLWVNQGNGTFLDQAMLRGCAVNGLGLNEAGMGIALTDLNQDGWWDLFLTHLQGESNTLYLSDRGNFHDALTPGGPGAVSWPFTGFGVAAADFNNDGTTDLFVVNGRVKYGPQRFDPNDPYAEPNHVLQGLGGGRFRLRTNPVDSTHSPLATSRALAYGDLDNDGWIDAVVVNRDGKLDYFHNRQPGSGNWVMFRVLNLHGSDAMGAAVTVYTADKAWHEIVQTGQSYCASVDPRVHVGLGDLKRVDRVVVRMPGQSPLTFGPFPAGKLYEIHLP